MIKQKNKHGKLYLYIIIGLLAFVFIASKDGLIKLISFRYKTATIKKEIYELAQENVKLEKEIKKLNSDNEYIEGIAREELGLIKQGEVLYKFVDTTKI